MGGVLAPETFPIVPGQNGASNGHSCLLDTLLVTRVKLAHAPLLNKLHILSLFLLHFFFITTDLDTALNRDHGTAVLL